MNIFSAYLAKGIQPLPIGYLTKYPCTLDGTSWKPYNRLGKLTSTPITAEDTALWDTWLEKGAGIGLAMGKHSGIIALDFDADNETTDAIKALLPKSPARKRGSKGLTAFYRWNGEKNKKWRAPNSSDYCLEILSTGNQTVVPPSAHPSGVEYKWIGESTLLELNPSDLPQLPDDFYQQVDNITGSTPKQHAEPFSGTLAGNPTSEEIKDALEFIQADCPYEDWLEIGMALQSELGQSGFTIWDNWSRTGSKYPSKGEPSTWQKWKSFKNEGITIATLFQKARLAGYSPEPVLEPSLYKIPLIERLKLEAADSGAKERVEDGFPQHLCDNATGLVADIQKWINSCAMYPQPALALSAAISVTGVLMAHRVKGSTDSRTNMYCLSIAPSGSGKDHPRKCIAELLIQSDNDHLMGGKLTSSAGLLKSINDGKGKRLMQPDEFGRVLKSMNNSHASTHMAAIPTMLIELFSSASGMYYGAEYANHDGSMKRKDVNQPCLSLHASTVPEHLFQAMTGTDTIDGFLSRWLCFEDQGYPDMVTPKHRIQDIPAELLEKIKALTAEKEEGNLANIGIKPKLIPFSEEANKLGANFCKTMRKRAQEKQQKGDQTYAIWTRTYEHATKLALVGHEGEEITAEVMKWALELATYCSQYLCDKATLHIADNEHEKDLKKILVLIKKSGKKGITKSELTRKTQNLNGKTRNDILTSLLDGEQITVDIEQDAKKPKAVYRYVKV